jgi:hypothetical protein
MGEAPKGKERLSLGGGAGPSAAAVHIPVGVGLYRKGDVVEVRQTEEPYSP